MAEIKRTTTIENLVEDVPGVVSYLIERGLPCIVCGQPVWGTLEDIARDRGLSDVDVEALVADMNKTLGIRTS
jgi:hypothetical protein